MAQVTVMTGPQRRRRWSDTERAKILEAVFAPGAVVAGVARRFDVATNLIYKWPREQLTQSQPAFLPAMIIEPSSGTEPPDGSDGAIVVHFAHGDRVVIDVGAPVALVSATLKALRR